MKTLIERITMTWLEEPVVVIIVVAYIVYAVIIYRRDKWMYKDPPRNYDRDPGFVNTHRPTHRDHLSQSRSWRFYHRLW